MITGLIKDQCFIGTENFKELDERWSNNSKQGEDDMKFYREVLYEVYDEQFITFCATSLHILTEQNSELSLSKIEYLANKGFIEYSEVL